MQPAPTIIYIFLSILIFTIFVFLSCYSWLQYTPVFPKRRVICFVTDKRAAHFALRKGKKDEVRSYPLTSLRRLKVKVYSDGSGNIVFKLKTYARAGLTLPPQSTAWGWPPPSALWGWIEYGFFDVEDVETATQYLSELTGIRPTVRKNLILGVF